MKFQINLEVSPDDETLDDDELVEFSREVIEYVKDDVFQNFSTHETANFSFTVDSIEATDNTSD